MKRFFAEVDMLGEPAVRARVGRIDVLVVACSTWPGAYLGAWWRNRLGRFYRPWSPELRRRIAPSPPPVRVRSWPPCTRENLERAERGEPPLDAAGVPIRALGHIKTRALLAELAHRLLRG